MNVGEIMTERADVVAVEIPGTRDDALEYLQDRAFSSVPVIKKTDGGEVYRGIVSRGALIERPDEDQLALLASEVDPTTSETELRSVAERMLVAGDRRVPVVEDDRLEGIVTVTDVVRAIAREEDTGLTVADVASEAVNCVYAETPLTVAERELSHAGVPYAVVLDDEGTTGILTEVDILAVARVVEGETETGESIANQDDEWAWEGIKAVGNSYMPTRNVEIPDESVSAFMTGDIVSISGSLPVAEAAKLMIEHGIEQIPMMEGNSLAGIVQDIHLLEAVR
ncbi:MAG: putative transcriptional regulator [halophilic archaeon J07HX64]|jgi:Predicted transcriptional regulator with C-terminal CBS domains|nr:MAG: putative transcriptional regulator [halophilic archaeon J07HX64]